MDVGITSRGLEDIGDINTITSSNSNIGLNKKINAGDYVIDIEWDGHVRSESDELYHASWETFTKETAILSPVSGTIRNMNIVERPSIHTVLDDDTTLFSVEVDDDTYQALSLKFINEEMYKKALQNLPRGIFHDDNDDSR